MKHHTSNLYIVMPLIMLISSIATSCKLWKPTAKNPAGNQVANPSKVVPPTQVSQPDPAPPANPPEPEAKKPRSKPSQPIWGCIEQELHFRNYGPWFGFIDSWKRQSEKTISIRIDESEDQERKENATRALEEALHRAKAGNTRWAKEESSAYNVTTYGYDPYASLLPAAKILWTSGYSHAYATHIDLDNLETFRERDELGRPTFNEEIDQSPVTRLFREWDLYQRWRDIAYDDSKTYNVKSLDLGYLADTLRDIKEIHTYLFSKALELDWTGDTMNVAHLADLILRPSILLWNDTPVEFGFLLFTLAAFGDPLLARIHFEIYHGEWVSLQDEENPKMRASDRVMIQNQNGALCQNIDVSLEYMIEKGIVERSVAE